MKKLSLKKTTLSRLNKNDLAKVKGGDHVELPDTMRCPTQEICLDTGLCVTGATCNVSEAITACECAPTDIC